LLRSTAEAGLRLAAGRALSGAVPSKVVSLTQGVLKAMLLTKLKVASWAVGVALLAGVGAVGVSYRASAQTFGPRESRNEQRSGVAPAPKVGRPAADDLESLRLEIDALRRELRATRDMVKALQAEVRGKKEADVRPERGAEKLWRQDARKLEAEKLHRLEALRLDEGKLRQLDARKLEAEKLRRLETLRRKEALEALSRKEASGPLAELEDAVKALRKDPKDKRAAEAIDRALRRLKEQPKPNKPGPQGYNPIEF
jgi:hypothetical protein